MAGWSSVQRPIIRSMKPVFPMMRTTADFVSESGKAPIDGFVVPTHDPVTHLWVTVPEPDTD